LPVAFVDFAKPEVAFHARNGTEPGVLVPSRNQQSTPKIPSAMYLFLQELFERGPNIVREVGKKKIGRERKESRRALIPDQSLNARKDCILSVTTLNNFTSKRS
jgi:hypothetical protein